jgi:transposase-like protein/DDE family transposase
VARRTKLAPLELEAEYEGAELGDKRLNGRLVKVAKTVATSPAASFPKVASDDADLEGTYRFVNNPRVTAEGILAPHRRETARRARAAKTVVVAHDTTECNFGKSARVDLGRVGRGQSYGFYAHFALAIEADEHRTPLGVVGLGIHTRTGTKGRRGHRALQSSPDNEFHRWPRVLAEARMLLEPEVSAIHVMDREADSYAFMADLCASDARFVIRMAQATRSTVPDGKVAEACAGATVRARREVPITARGRSPLPSNRKRYPPRKARVAKLKIAATQVTLKRPASANKHPARTLSLNVVVVTEPKPPKRQAPIEWRLWTREPVDTPEQVLAIVDYYRCRWRIEEYFKALKTGCSIEKRQLETHDALVNVLALYSPIAWRLLRLRTIAQRPDKRPASEALTPTQLICLRQALAKLKNRTLPPNPTARDAMLGVAALGGHIKNNGDPGWIVVGRGLDELLIAEVSYEAGYNAAMAQLKM